MNLLFAQYCSHIVSNLGANANAGEFPSAYPGRWITFWGDPVLADKVRVQTTITPRTTSTDEFATEENQSVTYDWTTLNANMKANPSSIGVNAVFDVATPVSGADIKKWKTDGTAGKYTNSGLHPTTAGYDLVTAAGAVDLSVLGLA